MDSRATNRPCARFQAGTHITRRFHGAAIVQHGVFQQIALERIQAKRLFILAQHGRIGEIHAQAAAEKILDGLAQEAGQLAQLQTRAGIELVRAQRQHGGLRIRIRMRHAPFARVGQQAIGLEIAAAERLQRMLGGERRQVPVQRPAGGQVIAQL